MLDYLSDLSDFASLPGSLVGDVEVPVIPPYDESASRGAELRGELSFAFELEDSSLLTDVLGSLADVPVIEPLPVPVAVPVPPVPVLAAPVLPVLALSWDDLSAS